LRVPYYSVNSDAAMTSERSSEFGFAVAHDAPIPYLQRIRDYYKALGYGAPYEWAHYAEVPFRPLAKSLSRSRITIITTAAPYQPDKGDQGPGAPYNAASKFYTVYSGDTAKDHDLRIAHIAIDRKHTTAEDPAAYFPLAELRRRAASGRIGAVAARFHGAPTNRSHRVTLEVDGPEIVVRCKEDGVDAAILVPNCPVCHQTVSLVARILEENGISTIVMGCAKDIVEYVGVPRFLFSDFPLGNAAGRPKDPVSQAFTLELALSVLETAPAPRTTVQSPLIWNASPDWKLDYSNVERLTPEEIGHLRAEFDKGKTQARCVREEAGLIRSDAGDEIA
jgi:D-proline reductase (dithiol) PrdB